MAPLNITYKGLEPIVDTSPQSVLVINGTDSDDDLVLEMDSANPGMLIVRSLNGSMESVSFFYPSISLTINLLGGDDQWHMEELDPLLEAWLSIDGGDGVDTFFGPLADSSWTVTGMDEGFVGAVVFAGFENLTGAAENQDTFAFEPAGGLTGTVVGGDGGFDIIAFNDGDYATVIHRASGPDSGSVILDGRELRYVGMEPVLINVGTVAVAIFEMTAGADLAVLENNVGVSGHLTLRSTNGTFELTSIPFPTMSLTIRAMGGDDVVTLNTLAPAFVATLTIDGGPGVDTVLNLSGRAPDAIARTDVEVFTDALPNWTSQGPGPITLTHSTAGIVNNPAIGAITSIAIHPMNPDIVFVGTVDGGIWKTTNFTIGTDGADNDVDGLTDADDPDEQPHWTPLTDQLPSLAISTLVFDPADLTNLTLWAGTGKVSSSSRFAFLPGMLLKTTNGGISWQVFQTQFATDHLTITAIIPTQIVQGAGHVVLVATDHNPKQAPGVVPTPDGLFRSTDGGRGGFVRISGDLLTSLPAGRVTDLAEDPGDPMHLRYYAAVAGAGVFVSTDGGSTWNPVNNGPLAGAVAATSRILLAVSRAAGNPLYAALINPVEGTLEAASPAAIGNTTLRLNKTDLFKAGDNESLFNKINDTLKIRNSITGLEEILVITRVTQGATFTDVALKTPLTHGYAVANTKITLSFKYRLSGIFRSANQGATWTRLDLPTSVENHWTDFDGDLIRDPGELSPINQLSGVLASGQGLVHFSMAADPANANILYVGGDTQPELTRAFFGTTNQMGLTGWVGRLFRGDAGAAPGSQWKQIVGTDAAAMGAGASGTAPHADSRRMVFDVSGNLIETDDGGIYLLKTPNVAARRWQSMNGDLALTEFYSVAWKKDAGVIFGGAQDNNVDMQHAPGSLQWDNVIGGDGAIVQTVDTPSLVFFSTQRLGNFQIRNSGPTEFPDLRIFGAVNGPDGNQLDLNTFDDTLQFIQPYAVNAIDPKRILFGTEFLYESKSATVPGIADTLHLLNIPPPAPGTLAVPTPAAKVGRVNALIYGGKQGLTDTPNIGYAGTQGNPAGQFLFVRLSAGNFAPFVPVASWHAMISAHPAPNVAVKSIAVDPADWRRVYVLDVNGRVWFSTHGGDSPAGDWDWKDLTANLLFLPGGANFQKLVVDTVGGATVLLAGGAGGLFRRVGNDPANAGQRWTEYGAGLPNVIVADVDFVTGTRNANAAFDSLLLAGTFGRGAWTIPDAGNTLGRVSTLVVEGGSGRDAIDLERDADRPWLLNVFIYTVGSLRPAAPVVRLPFASLDSIRLNGQGGDDLFTIDFRTGPITTPGGITIDGGTGADNRIEFTGPILASPRAPTRHTLTTVVNSGTYEIDERDVFDQAGTQVVRWINIQTPHETLALAPAIDGLGTALASLGASLRDGLPGAMQGRQIAAIDPQSLATGLNHGDSVGEAGTGDDPGESEGGEEDGGGSGDVLQINGPGSLLERLFEGGLHRLRLDDISSQGTIADPVALRQALDDLDATPGNVTLDQTTDVDGDGTPDITLHVLVAGLRLGGRIHLDVAAHVLRGTGEISLHGDLDVDAEVDLDLTFGVDGRGFFIRPSAASAPAVRVRDMSIDGQVEGGGSLGFLGVEIREAILSLDPAVEIGIRLLDPGRDAAADGLIRSPELRPAAFTDLLAVDVTGHPGDAVNDVTFTGTFDVAALLPGVESSITLGRADITLAWPDIGRIDQVQVSASSDAGQAFLDFLHVASQQVIDQLREVRNQLDALVRASSALGVEVPFVQDSLETVIDIVEAFDTRILGPLNEVAEGRAVLPTAQELAVSLASMLGLDLDEIGLRFEDGALTYHLDFTHVFPAFTQRLIFGLDLGHGLAAFKASADASLRGSVSLDMTFGLDLGALVGGASPVQAFFLKDVSLGGSLAFDIADFDASAAFGFLDLDLVNADAQGNVTFRLPLVDRPALGEPPARLGRITLQELGLGDPARLLGAPVIGGSYRAHIPVEARLRAVSSRAMIDVAQTDVADSGTFSFNASGSITLEILDLGGIAGPVTKS